MQHVHDHSFHQLQTFVMCPHPKETSTFLDAGCLSSLCSHSGVLYIAFGADNYSSGSDCMHTRIPMDNQGRFSLTGVD